MFKYTIISSFYKSCDHINNFIQSIIIQKIKPHQLIIVDDGYNGNSFESRLLFYKEKYKLNLILIKNHRNLGPALSYNRALQHNTSDYVFRLDADDIWLKNHVNLNKEIIEKNKNKMFFFNKIKLENHPLNKYLDNYFINHNSAVHSSWVINIKLNKNFRYAILNNKKNYPDDYFTIYKYITKNKKYKFLPQKTTIHKFNTKGHGFVNKKNNFYLLTVSNISKNLFKYNLNKDIKFLYKFGLLNILIFFYKNYLR
jgi:glycosyltransferase involved in cell wall biosynthesis